MGMMLFKVLLEPDGSLWIKIALSHKVYAVFISFELMASTFAKTNTTDNPGGSFIEYK